MSATEKSGSDLPSEVSISQDIRKMSALTVNLTLDDGTTVKVMVDTGSYETHLDNSLAPYLGKKKRSEKVIFPAMGWIEADFYEFPKLYLNGTLLDKGGQVAVYPLRLRKSKDAEIRGILGMDCLKHYCLQIDPEAGKLRFLDPHGLDKKNLGRAYDMNNKTYMGAYFINGNLLGDLDTQAVLDTGWSSDGALQIDNFRRAVRQHRAMLVEKGDPMTSNPPSKALMEVGKFRNGNYTNLIVEDTRNIDIIGLRFLSRHLATLDFPGLTLYLKRIDDTATVNGISSLLPSKATSDGKK